MRHTGLDPVSPASSEGFKLILPLINPLNYATLNQLCIQAHSSSLRCGGSLCKVQGDNMPPCHCGYISLIVDLFSIKIIPLYKLYALEEIISFAILNTS